MSTNNNDTTMKSADSHAGHKRRQRPEQAKGDDNVAESAEKKKKTEDDARAEILGHIAQRVHDSDCMSHIRPLADLIAAYAEPPSLLTFDNGSREELRNRFYRLDDLFMFANEPSHGVAFASTQWIDWAAGDVDGVRHSLHLQCKDCVPDELRVGNCCLMCGYQAWPEVETLPRLSSGFRPITHLAATTNAYKNFDYGAIRPFICKMHNPAGKIRMDNVEDQVEANKGMVLVKHTREYMLAQLSSK
jgi:hypothetical protein